MELRGKTAIITGSSGVLGSVIAEALASAGCNCICHYHHNKQKALRLVEQIQKQGAKAIAVQADLTNQSEIEKLFEKTDAFGVSQILINSAGIFLRQSLGEVTFEEAQRVLNLNLTAAILTSKAFAKRIETKFGNTDSAMGKIINISDVGGIKPWAEYVVYCSSKAGLIGATKALAKELAPKILVNCIAPGIVVDWQEKLDETQRQRQLSFIPMGRIGSSKEITEAIIFMLKNDYITGQVLNVDGGRCI
jgi:NAD(P)-dependent dehydrogenase (short-subunit alcohol dehydrogenase family)